MVDDNYKKPLITKYVADQRIKLILKGLKRFNKQKTKILDVGCGDGYVLNAIKRKGYDIIGIDKLTPEEAKWMIYQPDHIMDATKMKFKDDSFDVIISLEVVEHCPCISEINRVLKPNGRFFCSTPTPGTDWVRKILIFFKTLEDQDLEGHNHIVDLRKVPMKLLKYKKMFLGTSQFGILTK